MILYADDDLDDRAWVSDACKIIDCSLKIEFVENGREVLDYLQKLVQSLPELIVLDLNMPEMDGRQTLQHLKSNPQYKHIPVVIVTTSANILDRETCNRLGAAAYLIKPDTYIEWQNIVRQLEPLVN